jgi:hypothetical protein
VSAHNAGSFHQVGVKDLFAARPFAPNLAAILIFWRLLGDPVPKIWLARAKSRPQSSVYGTEGQRFESSRAR